MNRIRSIAWVSRFQSEFGFEGTLVELLELFLV